MCHAHVASSILKMLMGDSCKGRGRGWRKGAATQRGCHSNFSQGTNPIDFNQFLKLLTEEEEEEGEGEGASKDYVPSRK